MIVTHMIVTLMIVILFTDLQEDNMEADIQILSQFQKHIQITFQNTE